MKFLDFLAKFFATVGFVGYLPYAPGTWGSLFIAIIHFSLPSFSLVLSLVILALLFLLGLIVSARVEKISGVKDPSIIVIDEAIGIFIALFLLPKVLTLYFLAFIIFRILDILKPYPINKFQDFSGSFGIIMDDVLAGVLTFVFMQILQLLI